jgi:hypothetical protein
MGRNQDLRRKIDEHEDKIRRERMKPDSDELLIGHWQREIEARKKEVERLTRRLKRAW